MSPRRDERAAPPPIGGEYDLRFASNQAAEGWEQLGHQVRDEVLSLPCLAVEGELAEAGERLVEQASGLVRVGRLDLAHGASGNR